MIGMPTARRTRPLTSPGSTLGVLTDHLESITMNTGIPPPSAWHLYRQVYLQAIIHGTKLDFKYIS